MSVAVRFALHCLHDRLDRRFVVARGGDGEGPNEALAGPAALWIASRSSGVRRKANTQSSSRCAFTLGLAGVVAAVGPPLGPRRRRS